MGVQFAATIGVFGFLGYWLDAKWGTSPWLLIAFIFLGFFGGLISMVSKVSKLGSTAKPKPPKDGGDEEGS